MSDSRCLTSSEKLGSGSVGEMRRLPRGLGVEGLESRLNLSTLTGLGVPLAGEGAVATQEVSVKKYRIEALAQSQGGAAVGKSFVNAAFADAQKFFNTYRSRFKTPSPYSPPTTPTTPTPPTTPTLPDNTNVTPLPDPVPAPTVGLPVTVTQNGMGAITRLTITGTTGNDSIVVSQSGNTLTIVGNGNTTTVTGTFGELAIYGGAGDDTIAVQSSVNIRSLLYGGTGNNTISALGSAKSYIVTIGAGTDNVTGNGVNTSFWTDTGDTVNASGAEAAAGGVHKVSGFYQPFTTNSGSADYVPTSLNGQNLKDPTDSGTTVRLNNSLWGTGSKTTDINQGSVGDCYFLAPLQSLAQTQPNTLEEMAVDLGDGTYAVQFKRMGVTTYVRVDGDLPSGYWAGGLAYQHPQTAGGSIWGSIMEKAYAFFRTGGNTYDSLNWGWTGSAFNDLGVTTTTYSTGSASLFNTLTTAVTNSKAIAFISNSSVASGIPIVASHAYSIVATSVESGVQYVTVRNPWGTDGAGNDGVNDGLLKITMAAFQSAFSAGSVQV